MISRLVIHFDVAINNSFTYSIVKIGLEFPEIQYSLQYILFLIRFRKRYSMLKLLGGFRSANFRLPNSGCRHVSTYPGNHRLGSRLSSIKLRRCRSGNQQPNRLKLEAPHQYALFEQPQLGQRKPESEFQLAPWLPAVAVLVIFLIVDQYVNQLSSYYTGYYRVKGGNMLNDDPFLL